MCWVFISVQGLSLVVASGGHSSSRCAGLSLSRPLLLRSTGSRHTGSVIVAHGPICSVACGIFPDQGLNPCPLHWQADSQPLHHQGSPRERFLKTGWGTGVMGYMISLWVFFWLVSGEKIRSQHHQPSGSNMSGVYVLVGSIELTSSIWWGFQYEQNISKDMAQHIFSSPWGGTEGPWLCLMGKLLLFCLSF